MELEPVTAAQDLRRCYETLRGQWADGAQRLDRYVGYQGGGGRFTVWWRPGERMWAIFDESAEVGRYWCGYGTEDATRIDSLSPIVEINMPIEGENRQVGGDFVKDWLGVIWLVHSGAVGGGRKGIGKTAFLNGAAGRQVGTVRWRDGQSTKVRIVARLTDSRLPRDIAAYARAVEAFKRSATQSGN
jgi:hypothetical protein